MTTETKPPARIDYGWANGWKDKPDRVKACEVQGHQVKSQNLDPSNHGLETFYWCDLCGYQYRVDSSG